LFDWTGVTPTGAFVLSSPYTWNLTSLYTTGEVTLLAIPSYQAKDLSGIRLQYNNLTGANFAGQNLTNADFFGATLSGADLTAADARGAFGLHCVHYSGATIVNLIQPEGHIAGLDLTAGGLLVVRDYDGDSRYEPSLPPIPITIDTHFEMGPHGTLRMVFEGDAWDSTISFATGIPVALGGTLELTFADEVNLATQVGRTLDLFDWTGVLPTGTFAISSPYAWDLSNLYATGQVTLTAIPEPSIMASLMIATIGWCAWRRRPSRPKLASSPVFDAS
jgi:Pentapeptide repeats (8 copies)